MKKFFILCFVIFLFGCSQEISYEPREINPDIDVCEVCNMSIVHTDYATQLIEKDGTIHIYDDIGCMFEYLSKEGQEKEIEVMYVRDTATSDWLNIEEAYFVYDPDYWTPMMYGVISFKTIENAESFIEKEGKGKLVTYEDLNDLDWGY